MGHTHHTASWCVNLPELWLGKMRICALLVDAMRFAEQQMVAVPASVTGASQVHKWRTVFDSLNQEQKSGVAKGSTRELRNTLACINVSRRSSSSNMSVEK